MTKEIRDAESQIVAVLQEADGALSVTQVVERVQKKSEIMERYIRPSFWSLASAGKIKVDSSFKGELSKTPVIQ